MFLGTVQKASCYAFLQPSVYRPLTLAVLLMVFQECGGITSVGTYASSILADVGFNHAEVVAITFAAVEVVDTRASCLVVDKLGRRTLLIFSGILMGVSMAIVGLFFCVRGLPAKPIDLV